MFVGWNSFLTAYDAMEKKGKNKSRFGKSGRVEVPKTNEESQQLNARQRRFIIYVSSHCFE